jgi:death on curing protein
VEITFLGLDEVVRIHWDQVNLTGGSQGIRDLELLKSAIAVPGATFGGDFLHSDLFEMAAAYLFHIVKNHPFVDGNKRTGAVAALLFLQLNGIRVEGDEDELAALVWSVARGDSEKPEVADFLRRHC